MVQFAKISANSVANSVVAFIAIGGNLGSCRATFIAARQRLTNYGAVVVASSPLYRTEAVGGPSGQPDYLNAVLQVETCLRAEELLQLCFVVEQEAGRKRKQRWGARTLDLDLLLYEQLVCATPELILPHPRLHQRRFVLEPLCVLAGDRQHPLLGVNFTQLLHLLPTDSLQPAVQLVEVSW